MLAKAHEKLDLIYFFLVSAWEERKIMVSLCLEEEMVRINTHFYLIDKTFNKRIGSCEHSNLIFLYERIAQLTPLVQKDRTPIFQHILSYHIVSHNRSRRSLQKKENLLFHENE
jgi:hypothetical protein